MASKKSSSPVASATPSPRSPRSPSPSPTQSPATFEHSMYVRRRFVGKSTIATTPPPTTTTPSPAPDPNEYEKSAHRHVSVTDSELDLLKEHVRLLHGLPPTVEKPLRRITTLGPPKVLPRPTLTSARRSQLQQRRMVVRCGGNIKAKFDEYDRMVESDDSALAYRRLREDAMAHTAEEMDLQFEHQELQNLKYLAEHAKRHEVLEYRDNQGSRLRFKHIRGEPIISSNFRDSYDSYTKPPFALQLRIRQPSERHLPKIDKRKEIWLLPVADDGDEGRLPQHAQLRTPDPKDKRTRKQRARPAVKKGARTTMADWKAKQSAGAKAKDNAKGGTPKSAKRRRPPWRGAPTCQRNFG